MSTQKQPGKGTKPKEQPVAVKVTPAAESNEPITPHEEVMSVDQYKESYAVKFDTNKAAIAALKKKLAKIEITGPEDTKNYELVKQIKKDSVSMRTAADGRRSELKEPHLRRGQAIDGYYKELEAPLKEVQTLAEAKLKVIDDAVKEENLRLEREAQEKLDARVSELKAAGLTFDGDYYVIANISTDLATIGKLKDEQYAGLLGAVKDAKKVIDDAKAEEERLAAEERQRLADQQAEIDRKEREQREREAELNRREQEMQRKEQEQKQKETEARQRNLQALGLSFAIMDSLYRLNTASGIIEVMHDDVVNLDEAAWQTKLEAAQTLSREINAKEQARIKEEQAITDRTNRRTALVLSMGFVWDSEEVLAYYNATTDRQIIALTSDIKTLSDDLWDNAIKDFTAEISEIKGLAAEILRQQAADLEKERQANLSDAQKVEEYTMELMALFSGTEKPVLSLVKNEEALHNFQTRILHEINTLTATVTNN